MNSSFYKRIVEQNGINENCRSVIDGVTIQPLLLGGPAYPVLPWLIKPFPGDNLPTDKFRFNFWHSSTRMDVENAFGGLKTRFRCLLKRFDCATEMIPDVVVACCTLHNFCEVHAEEINPGWLEEVTPKLRNQTLKVTQLIMAIMIATGVKYEK